MEQRDLTKLLPESWREVVKRTMTTVQQQANTQWKSIEGQLANWVQDKLKAAANSVGAAASGSSSSSSSASSGGSSSGAASGSSAAASAPVANILASVGSTAMNILGLGAKNTSNSSPPSTSATSAGVSSPPSSSSSPAHSSAHHEHQTATVSKAKTEKPSSQTTPKGPLAGVAGLIMNTLTNRSSAPSLSTSESNEQKSPVPAADSTSAQSSISSQYPTLSGVQQEASDSHKVDVSPSTAGSLPSLSLAGPTTSNLAGSTTPSS